MSLLAQPPIRSPDLRTNVLFGILDQAIISATGFVSFVTMTRSTSSATVGMYVILVAISLFLASLQSALFTTPLTVYASPLSARRFSIFATSLLVGQIVFIFLLCIIVCLSFFLTAQFTRLALPSLFWLLIWLCAIQTQEYGRRVLYARARPGSALVNDLANYGLQALLFVVLWQRQQLTLNHAITITAITSCVASSLGILQTRRYFTTNVAKRWFFSVYSQTWQYARWLVGTNIVGAVAAQASLFFVSALLGLTATAILRTVQTLTGPANILLRFMDTSLPPIAVEKYVRLGPTALYRFLGGLVLVLTGPILIGIGVSYLAGDAIIERVFGSQYAASGWLLTGFAINFLLAVFSAAVGLGLKAQSRGLPGFVAQLAAAAMAVTMTPLLIAHWQLAGALVGILLGQFTILAVQFFALRPTWIPNFRFIASGSMDR